MDTRYGTVNGIALPTTCGPLFNLNSRWDSAVHVGRAVVVSSFYTVCSELFNIRTHLLHLLVVGDKPNLHPTPMGCFDRRSDCTVCDCKHANIKRRFRCVEEMKKPCKRRRFMRVDATVSKFTSWDVWIILARCCWDWEKENCWHFYSLFRRGSLGL